MPANLSDFRDVGYESAPTERSGRASAEAVLSTCKRETLKGAGGGLREDPNEATQHANPRWRLESHLERVGRGDRPAFEDLYRLSSAKLFAVCLRILPRRQEAEDALQDAYLTIWQRAGRFDPVRGSAIAWLTVITRNTAIDRLRARAPLSSLGAQDVADPAPAADINIISREQQQRLLACLDGLEASEAAFLRTAFLHDTTYAELAQRENLPLGTVKSRIRRALLKLRERLA